MSQRQSIIRVTVRFRDLERPDFTYLVKSSSGPWSRRWQSTFDRIANRETTAANQRFPYLWRAVEVARIA